MGGRNEGGRDIDEGSRHHTERLFMPIPRAGERHIRAGSRTGMSVVCLRGVIREAVAGQPSGSQTHTSAFISSNDIAVTITGTARYHRFGFSAHPDIRSSFCSISSSGSGSLGTAINDEPQGVLRVWPTDNLSCDDELGFI